MALTCDACGFKSNEVKGGGEKKSLFMHRFRNYNVQQSSVCM